MKITLDQTEIETAVRAYVNEQVSIKEGQRIDIDFTAGRGANGLSAAIDIVSEDSVRPSTEVTKTQPQTTASPVQAAPVSETEAGVKDTGETATAGETSDSTAGEAAATDAPESAEGLKTNSLFNGLNKPKNP